MTLETTVEVVVVDSTEDGADGVLDEDGLVAECQ